MLQLSGADNCQPKPMTGNDCIYVVLLLCVCKWHVVGDCIIYFFIDLNYTHLTHLVGYFYYKNVKFTLNCFKLNNFCVYCETAMYSEYMALPWIRTFIVLTIRAYQNIHKSLSYSSLTSSLYLAYRESIPDQWYRITSFNFSFQYFQGIQIS